jgi:DNA-binding HxlR family transcriptional regulator
MKTEQLEGFRKYQKDKSERLVLMLVAERPYRWSELWHGLKEKRSFSSKRVLHYVLTSLVKEGKVEREKISHKKVFYRLSGDAEKQRQIMGEFQKWEADFPEVINAIAATRKTMASSEARQFYKKVVLKELANFLDTLCMLVRAEPKWQNFVRQSLIRYNVEFFGLMLVEMGHTHPEIMDQCIGEVMKSLSI